MHTRYDRPGLEIFNGRGRNRPGKRMRRARFFRTLALIVAVPFVAFALYLGFQGAMNVIQPDPNLLAVLGYDGNSLAGARVIADNGQSTEAVEGGFASLTFDLPATLRVEAEGYHTATYTVEALPPEGPLFLQMEPLILQGRVKDNLGNGVPGAFVSLGDMTVETADFGSFEIVAATPGMVEVTKPTWETTQFEWDGSSERADIDMQPFLVKGLRIFGYDTSDEQYADLLRLADETVVNAFVFDTKNEFGEVMYLSEDEQAFPMEAIINKYDVHERLAMAKEHGLYTITRIVTFQDVFVGRHYPDHAVQDISTGGVWQTWEGRTWIDPTNRDSWDYPIRLGIEACEFGFDEIQFDYVRFPTDGLTANAVYKDPEAAASQEGRVATIAAFLEEARSQISPLGCAISADIFSIVMSVGNDQGIGQKIEELSYSVDALSPMLYPSHYGSGWLNLDNPNDHPETVMREALDKSVNRLEGGAHMRPWLQAFAWSTEQMREAIETADSYGIGWLLWNSKGEFEQASIPSAVNEAS
jgi:hypothetical protein